MPIVMKGSGLSGNRESATPPVPDSGASQPIQRTQGNEDQPGVNWGNQPTGNREASYDPGMPTSGGEATGTDLADPGATGSDTNDTNIFRGAPNTGTA